MINNIKDHIQVAIAPVLDDMTYASRGDIYFILANYYQKYDEYRDFFKNKREKKFTMVDNGAYEFGKPLSVKELLEIYNEANVDELILPDVEYDWKQTVELTKNALDELHEIYDYSNPVEFRKAPNVQIVLQGENYREMIYNCSEFVHERNYFNPFKSHKVTSLGVPLYKKNWRGRIQVIDWLCGGTTTPFHLLGLHDPIELAWYQEKHKIRSADGGFPVKFGCYEIPWSRSAELVNDKKKYPNDITKLKVDTDKKEAFIEHNINMLRGFAMRGNRIIYPDGVEELDKGRKRYWM